MMTCIAVTRQPVVFSPIHHDYRKTQPQRLTTHHDHTETNTRNGSRDNDLNRRDLQAGGVLDELPGLQMRRHLLPYHARAHLQHTNVNFCRLLGKF